MYGESFYQAIVKYTELYYFGSNKYDKYYYFTINRCVHRTSKLKDIQYSITP